jgi:polyhydroxybutyrate depolymerase
MKSKRSTVAPVVSCLLGYTLAACGAQPAPNGKPENMNPPMLGAEAGTMPARASITPTLAMAGIGSPSVERPPVVSTNTSAAAGGAGSGAIAGAAGVAAASGSLGSAGASGASVSSGTAVSMPIASSACGMRGGMRGKTSRTIKVGSLNRTFIAYLPEASSAATAVPLVYVFHGATQNGQWLYDATEYAKLADTENIAVVFPDGQDTSSATSAGTLDPWSVTDGPGLCGAGGLVSNPNPADFAFLDAMKKDVLQDQCLDDKHVFATGFSMGGYFTHHIACDRADFRAAAPHSGGTMASLESCKTQHMPIIIFHGNADPLIAAGCDDPKADAQVGFPPAATLWAKKNGCKDTYQTVPQKGTVSGNDGQCYVYDGCPADGQVELCAFDSLQHAWAGASVCEGCIGSGAGFASATKLEWEFFKTYAW